MYRARVLAIAVAAIAGLLVAAAELPASPVFWSAERPLTWNDFQAAPPLGMEKTLFVAQPFLTLSFRFNCTAKGNGVTATATMSDISVLNSVDPSLSWAFLTRVDSAVLHHEQLHFDLQEVYRRLIELTLRSLTITQPGRAEACKQALCALGTSMGQAILDRSKAAQARFETETENGQNVQAQAAWETQIAYLLANPAAAP